MVRSMTGFGVGSACDRGWRIEVTIRTLNHRFLSVRARSLGDRPWLQTRVEEAIRRAFSRGEVSISVSIERDQDASSGSPAFDLRTAAAGYAALGKLASELDLPAPTLEDLIRTGGLQPAEEREEELWPLVAAALESAALAARLAREEEGLALRAELLRILVLLDEAVAGVRERLPQIMTEIRDRLQERVIELAITVEASRFESEVALLADRYEVQEELIRLSGHIDRARRLLDRTDPMGKELDFLSQEMLREVNTVGSKARDSDVSGLVIDMKVAVEQLREQVQNVE